ncbi:hypothetical protein PUN28_003140 [Cardiocondyla obscurior]|uniref:Uncharacterized protein n=1 Tax=Cardiocondyla obscurior TaxID=286306 RepID=A0AAW2GKP0_9HYME
MRRKDGILFKGNLPLKNYNSVIRKLKETSSDDGVLSLYADRYTHTLDQPSIKPSKDTTLKESIVLRTPIKCAVESRNSVIGHTCCRSSTHHFDVDQKRSNI